MKFEYMDHNPVKIVILKIYPSDNENLSKINFHYHLGVYLGIIKVWCYNMKRMVRI